MPYAPIAIHKAVFTKVYVILWIAITAIWNILSKLEPYSAKGYLADKRTDHSIVISKSEGLALLRKRGYIFKDELTEVGF